MIAKCLCNNVGPFFTNTRLAQTFLQHLSPKTRVFRDCVESFARECQVEHVHETGFKTQGKRQHIKRKCENDRDIIHFHSHSFGNTLTHFLLTKLSDDDNFSGAT